MTYSSFAIIGTAGRKEDKTYLTKAHYVRMVNASYKLLDHLNIKVNDAKFYSGGAAWADHLIVTLALQGIINPKNVTIFLPCYLNIQGQFVDKQGNINAIEKTAQYYHKLFKDTTDIDGISDLLKVENIGATLLPGNSNFHARNSLVADAVSPDGILLAFTFGQENYPQIPWTIREFKPHINSQEAGLRDGGTADTFNKAKCIKWHCKIGQKL